MVKHHVKKKKGPPKRTQPTTEIPSPTSSDLDRFAGSSDEDSDSDSFSDGEHATSGSSQTPEPESEHVNSDEALSVQSSEASLEASLSEEEEKDDGPSRPTGMAGAMSRILSSASHSKSSSLVLSRTTTKEQRLLSTEKAEKTLAKKRRKERKDNNLTVMFDVRKGEDSNGVARERNLKR